MIFLQWSNDKTKDKTIYSFYNDKTIELTLCFLPPPPQKKKKKKKR